MKIDIAEETTCLACGAPIIQIAGRGHRQRLYCDDRCRQRAHRSKRQGNVTIDTNGDLQQRIAQLEQELAEKDELIERLLGKKQSKQPFKRQLQERLTRLLEQQDWPALDIHYRVKAGQKEGRVFIIGASIDLLSRALGQLEEGNHNQS